MAEARKERYQRSNMGHFIATTVPVMPEVKGRMGPDKAGRKWRNEFLKVMGEMTGS